jgi:hypothetical protein
MVGGRRFDGGPSGPVPLRHDAVPASVVGRAKDAFRRRASGVLAALVFDSAADDPACRGQRVLRFEHPGGRVEIIVTPASGGCAIRGRASPAAQRVELEPEGRDATLAREVVAGNFEFAAVPRGLVRVRLFADGGTVPVHTDWVRV